MRKQSRQCCYQLLFEYLFLGETEEDTFSVLKNENDLDDNDIEFICRTLEGIKTHEIELKEVIERFSEGFTQERIYKTDLAALLFGAYEILYSTETPPKVAINEAVELAKKFSSEKSGGFVNGILASILKEKEEIIHVTSTNN